MSATVISMFVRSPITGWSPSRENPAVNVYADTDDILRNFRRDFGHEVVSFHPVRQSGGAVVMRLSLRPPHSGFPGANQALYEAEIVVLEDRDDI